MCLIFDQRLLHKGKICKSTKYVLPTDLVCVGKQDSSYKQTELELKLEKLTKNLFRQAQLNELKNISSGNF